MCICHLVNTQSSNNHTIRYASLKAPSQNEKYIRLTNSTLQDECNTNVETIPPNFRFIPTNTVSLREYENAVPINVFWKYCCGIETKRDHFVIDRSREKLISRIREFSNSKLLENDLKKKYNVRDNDWNVVSSKNRLKATDTWESSVIPVVFRPFDVRYILYLDYVLARDRGQTMADMVVKENMGIVTTRQTKEDFGCLSIEHVCTHKIVSVYDRSFLFPLYSMDYDDRRKQTLKSNIHPILVNAFAKHLSLVVSKHARSSNRDKEIGVEDLYYYIYAQLFSTSYRDIFSDLLKIEYPRVFFTSDSDLFWSLCDIGEQLVSLHHLDFKCEITPELNIIGENLQIEKVSIDENVIWLDKKQSKGFEIEKPIICYKFGGRLPFIDWLRERQEKGGKNPRSAYVLSESDHSQLRKIYYSTTKTIEQLIKLDEIIERAGGFPLTGSETFVLPSLSKADINQKSLTDY